MKKLVLRIIGIFLCAFMLAACDFNGTTNGGSTEITTLETPTVMLVDNLLKWNEIKNASYYEVYVNNTIKEKVTALEYDFTYLTAGTYTLKVRACNDASTFKNSSFAAIKFVKELTDSEKTKLAAPILRIENNVLKWNSVFNAVEYEILVDDQFVTKTSDLEFSLSNLLDGNHIVKVRSLGDDSKFLPSDYVIIEFTPGYNTKNDDYTVFMINDTHGAFQTGDFPGLAKVQTIIKNLENTNGEIIKVANGDLFQGSYVSNILYGLPIIDGLNEMEFDAFVIGNHDFDWGLDKIKNYYDGNLSNGEANFPVLGANVIDKKTNEMVDWFEPYTIVEKNGVKVGIIGIIGYELESSILAENVADYEFIYPVTLVSEYAKELREELGCDSVIVSIHDYDQDLNNALARLSGTSTIDMILCGHTHQSITTTITGSNGKNIPVVQNRDKNRNAVSVNLNLTTFNYSSKVYYPEDYKEDSDFLELVSKYQKYIDEGNRVIGNASSYLNKSTLGKLAVDSMMEKYDVSMSIINTAGIRATINSGTITVAEVFEVFPFNNEIIIAELTGAQIKSMYNRNADFLYVNSGFNINNFNNTTVYKVAVIDYVFTGTYYKEFQNAPYTDTNVLLRDILIEYIETNF